MIFLLGALHLDTNGLPHRFREQVGRQAGWMEAGFSHTGTRRSWAYLAGTGILREDAAQPMQWNA